MQQKRMAVAHTCSVSRCKRSNTAPSHLVTSQVFTLRNIAEDGKYCFFALDKKSFDNPEAKQTCRFHIKHDRHINEDMFTFTLMKNFIAVLGLILII